MVNSARLWDNQLKTPSFKLPRAIFVSVIFTGILIGIVLSLILSLKLTATAQPRVNTKPKRAVIARVLPAKTMALDFNQQFLPEQDNPSVLLLHKIASPPPPPVQDCASMACVALTFDDGPDVTSTPFILSTLEREHVKASFFLIGNRVAANSTIVQQLALAGEDVGNHSWSHPDLTKLTTPLVQQQVNQTQAAIAATGVPAPHIFRPPYGAFRLAMLPDVNMPVILWNVDPKDWAQKDTQSIVQVVESQIKPGAIIVMHDKPLTAAALPKILQDLKGKYQFVTVTKLLNLQPDSRGEFIGR